MTMRKLLFPLWLALFAALAHPALAQVGGATGPAVWPITSGGTGQTTALGAFDAFSPLTTAGDILYFNAGHNARLPKGVDGTCLVMTSGVPTWGSCAGGGAVGIAGSPVQYQFAAWTSSTSIQGVGPCSATTVVHGQGASAYPSCAQVSLAADVTGALPLASLATQAANTIVANSTGATAAPAAVSVNSSLWTPLSTAPNAAGGFVLYSGALGTPASGNASNLTNIPGAQITGANSVPAGTLPLATTGAFGAVKPDGTTITVSAGVISAAGGGGTITANSTATSGFSDGDLLYNLTSKVQRLAIGSNGQYLGVSGGALAWGTPSGAGTVSSCSQYSVGVYLATGTTISCSANLTFNGATLALGASGTPGSFTLWGNSVGQSSTLTASTFTGATSFVLPYSGTANDPLLSAASTATETNKTFSGATNVWNGGSVATPALTLIGNQNLASWGLTGAKIIGGASTLQDTSAAGTVTDTATDALGGNTLTAANARTYTNYFTAYFKNPIASTNVTITNAYSLGLEGSAWFRGGGLQLGVQQTTQGSLILDNTAAGAFATTLQSSNSATAAYTLTLPTSAGSASQCLQNSGTPGILTFAACGTGSPGGSTTQVQYNNAGAFAGSSAFTWSSPTLTLGVQGTTLGQLALASSAAFTTTLAPSASQTASYTLTWPTSAGSASQCLQNSATPGILTFASCGGAASLAVGSTSITGYVTGIQPTAGFIAYDSGPGTYQEASNLTWDNTNHGLTFWNATGTTNYEDYYIGWTSNVFTISFAKGASGVARNFQIKDNAGNNILDYGVSGTGYASLGNNGIAKANVAYTFNANGSRAEVAGTGGLHFTSNNIASPGANTINANISSINGSANYLQIGAGSIAGAGGYLRLAALQFTGGSGVTVNTGTCTNVTAATGRAAGTFNTNSTGCTTTQTIVIASLPTSGTGYVCRALDGTTPNAWLIQTASTTTSATLTISNANTGTADYISYDCFGF